MPRDSLKLFSGNEEFDRFPWLACRIRDQGVGFDDVNGIIRSTFYLDELNSESTGEPED